MIIKNNPIQIPTPQYQSQRQTNFSQPIAFKSLSRIVGGNTLKPIDSFFYRDVGALNRTKQILQKFFPNGGVVLGGACSDGEELLSLVSLIENPDKYRFLGFDVSKDPIELAKNGVYTIFTGFPDSFLIKSDRSLSEPYTELKRLFLNVFQPTTKPDFVINNSPNYTNKSNLLGFQEEFFKVRDEFKDKIQFSQGDIKDIDQFNTNDEPVCAVLCRNVFYHVLDNHITPVIRGETVLIPQNINRQIIANNRINKVYEKLDPNGAFILGDHPKEHFILADEFTDPQNIMKLRDLPAYQANQSIFRKFLTTLEPIFEKFQCGKELRRVGEIKICRKSPIQIALEKDGRFKPLEYSNVVLDVDWFTEKQQFATVWQKVK